MWLELGKKGARDRKSSDGSFSEKAIFLSLIKIYISKGWGGARC